MSCEAVTAEQAVNKTNPQPPPVLVLYDYDFGWIVEADNDGEYEIVSRGFVFDFESACNVGAEEAERRNTGVQVFPYVPPIDEPKNEEPPPAPRPVLVEYDYDYGWIVLTDNDGYYEMVLTEFSMNYREALALARDEAARLKVTIDICRTRPPGRAKRRGIYLWD